MRTRRQASTRRPISGHLVKRLAIAALVYGLAAPAFAAEDWYTGSSKQTQRDDWIVAVDASTTYTSNNSQFANVVSTVALGGGTLSESGVRLRLEGLGGAYSYAQPTTGQQIHGQQYEAGTLVGYQEVWKNAAIAGFVGFDIRDNSLSTPDTDNSTVGTKIGLKAVAEAYLRPTEATMFSGYASYSTAHEAYYARLRAGYRLFDDAYVGPELAFLGDEYFGQSRIGVHLSGVRVGDFQFGISGGYEKDHFNGDGFYASFDTRAGF